MKKIVAYKIILIVLVIVAIILLCLIGEKYISNKKIENKTQEVLSLIKTKVENPETQNIIQEIDAEIEGYNVVGIIKIPKIELEYPVLEKTDKTSLSLSITKFWGNKLNQIGNVVLAGHNNFNGKMFGKIDKLEEGDIIEITDKQMVTIKYQVFNKYVVDPNDITCIISEDEKARELTLITCTNGDKERLVIKSREIKEN